MGDYMFVDADNHYYEAEDAFFRHGDEDVKRYIALGQRGQTPVHGVRLDHDRPGQHQRAEPDLRPDREPGAFHPRLKELQDRTGGQVIPLTDMHKAYGQLEHIPEGYRANPPRIDMIDEQNVERCLLFPTLGDCVEGLMHDNVPMAYKVFPARQPVAGGRLGLRPPRPPVRLAALHPDARSRPSGRGARVRAREGR